MSCKDIGGKFHRLYKNKDYKKIGELFTEANAYERKCLEVVILESVNVSSLHRDVTEILMHTSGKEKPLSHEALQKVLKDTIAVYLTETISRGYKVHLIVVRFRGGQQRALKSLSSKDRALEIFGVLKMLAIVNKLKA